MRRLTVLIAIFLLLAWIGTPARAGSRDLASGALAFEGTVDLAAGTWSGVFTGEIAGSYRQADGTSVPWTVLITHPASADMTSVERLGCAAETVSGRFRMKTDNYQQVFGAWADNVVPRTIVAIDASLDFVWHRVGSAGAMVLTDATVDVQLYTATWTDFGSGGGWVRVLDSSAGDVGGGSARLETSRPSSCDAGVLKGDLVGLALSH